MHVVFHPTDYELILQPQSKQHLWLWWLKDEEHGYFDGILNSQVYCRRPSPHGTSEGEGNIEKGT